ncbi:MAG: membrane associated rhomboid family serine protease [Paraglaciecola sp.]|jgi:membrane associated rhomboid family serine protease|uniref:rhomboid family intramembrane serine protease n=1 Tax=Polaribacter sp. TaxID=1920175 RepID=UPI003AE53ED8
MNIIQEIKNRYITGNIIEKLIFINIGVFVFALLLTVFSRLYNGEGNFIVNWFSLDDNFTSMFTKPWSIISYGFLHGGFLHILFNLIGLYFIGNLFLQYFSEKQLLSFYLLGTFFGGILYLLSQNYFPLFEGKRTYLVGASAGVSAIFVGVATHIPNYQLKIRFIGYVKLWYLAAIWVGLDILGLVGTNAGGNFAHLGGALFGFLYVKRASNKEITVFDSIGNLFKKKEKTLKTVYKSAEKKKQTQTNLNQEQIDKILDKISKSGYDTLTKLEKEFLFKQGKK